MLSIPQTADTVEAIAYDVATAAEVTGASPDVIRRAIAAGDLTAYQPQVAGRPVAKVLVTHRDLVAWLTAPPAEVTR